jgi:hypothetical protein
MASNLMPSSQTKYIRENPDFFSWGFLLFKVPTLFFCQANKLNFKKIIPLPTKLISSG